MGLLILLLWIRVELVLLLLIELGMLSRVVLSYDVLLLLRIVSKQL